MGFPVGLNCSRSGGLALLVKRMMCSNGWGLTLITLSRILLAVDEVFGLEDIYAQGAGAADGNGGLDAVDLQL